MLEIRYGATTAASRQEKEESWSLWDGPYEIAEQTTRGTYKLKCKSGKILKQGIGSINLKFARTQIWLVNC